MHCVHGSTQTQTHPSGPAGPGNHACRTLTPAPPLQTRMPTRCCLQSPKAGNCRKALQLEKCHGDRDPSPGKPRSQRRQDGHHGILRAAWSTLPRQGEAERVKRSHCEPASEPVTSPHPPQQGDCHRHSSRSVSRA